MSDIAKRAPKDEPPAKPWRDQIPTIIAAAVIGGIITATLSFGGQMMKTSSTSDVLVSKVERIEKQNDGQDVLLKEIYKAQAGAYTIEMAQRDRDASERRFQSLEGRIGELARRIDVVEANQRFMQQFVMDKASSTRRP